MAKIAILGLGTVGTGVAEILEMNKERVLLKSHEDISVKLIYTRKDHKGDKYEPFITHNFDDIINDTEISVIAECMGGLSPAYEYTKKALQAGKSVVTSNKELVATHGLELITIAKNNCVSYLFEGSVGGGIPVLNPLSQALGGDNITEIKGILNGTTNYILTEMTEKGSDYADVLKAAQDLGYAEKDPTADVEGHDACRKIAILSFLATNKMVDYKKIHTEGITKITKTDILYAKHLGCKIKLVGHFKKAENGSFIRVTPLLISKSSPLYMVDDVFNAVMITGDAVGDTMFYGRGAGKMPTGSAVVSDIVFAVRNKNKHIDMFLQNQYETMLNNDNNTVSYMVSVSVSENKNVKALFGKEIVTLNKEDTEGYFVTDKSTEKELSQKLEKLENKRYQIRIEG